MAWRPTRRWLYRQPPSRCSSAEQMGLGGRSEAAPPRAQWETTMSSPDRASGPQITKDVLYNNSGTITAATIYAVLADGRVSLVFYSGAGATSASPVSYDPNLGTGKWAYPAFQ